MNAEMTMKNLDMLYDTDPCTDEHSLQRGLEYHKTKYVWKVQLQ